jgi:hypothetical protein
MKIRNGFVSNSSSSSFIIIIPSENFKEITSKMESIEAKIIEDIASNEKVIGVDAKVVKYVAGNDCSLTPHDLTYELQLELEKELGGIIEDDPYIFYEAIDDAIYKYGEIVKKHEKGYYHEERN